MNKIKLLFSVLLLGLPLQLFADHDQDSDDKGYVGKQLILNAKGYATAYPCEVPPTDIGTTSALCFDVPFFNLKTGRYLGTMRDALNDVATPSPGAIVATATSTFHFTERYNQSRFTTRVRGQVQPLLEPHSKITHMTSYTPEPGDNNIMSGTRRFEYAKGTARESGAVDLSGFTGQPGGVIGYDLIWVISFY